LKKWNTAQVEDDRGFSRNQKKNCPKNTPLLIKILCNFLLKNFQKKLATSVERCYNIHMSNTNTIERLGIPYGKDFFQR
jgi:hypothetical protein